MTEIQNSKQAFVFEHWNLGFNWNLVLGICYLLGFFASIDLLLRKPPSTVNRLLVLDCGITNRNQWERATKKCSPNSKAR